MTEYVVRRLWGMFLVIFLILTVTFVLAYLIPADPARAVAGPRARPETLALIRQDLGLDQPLHVQYFRYLSRLLQGDLGTSYRLRLPVAEILLRRLPATAQLAFAGVLFELLMGIPVGIISAVRPRSLWDRLFMLVALFGVAAPSFWLGLVLLYVFGFLIPIFPLGGRGGLMHLVLPAITLGLAGGAWYARMLRSSMLDILDADYVRTARAKGLPERAVVWRHALRNAIQPVVTMVGMDLGYYLGGLVLIEAVFSWPGIGYEMWQAIGNLDIPVIVGTITFAAVAIVVMNFVVDLLYSVIDPRVRLNQKPT
jgi:peptide/nickel transport system permease protein